MAGLERVDGGMRLRLDADEVDVVASLAEGLAARLAHAQTDPSEDDEVLDRLAPVVSRGDRDVDAELRAMLRADLVGSRVARLHDLAGTLRGDGGGSGVERVLDRDEAMRIVEALNDLRIALAATIGYEALDRDALGPDDRRADAVRLLDALAWLQGGLIDFVDTD
jgi:hypothetical protein